MKKEILIIFVLVLSISMISAAIQTKNSRGAVTTNFFTSDEVFLRSGTGLCNSFYDLVDVYIIESGNTILVDVRGFSQKVNLTNSYAIPSNTKIWEGPEEGDYDVIIDCDSSGAYHPLEPKTSFSVQFKKGSASLNLGKEIIDHTWQYDSEKPDLINEIIQLSLLAEGENIELKNITIQALGIGDDTQIDVLEVYIDGNDNNILDKEEIFIGSMQPAYSLDNGVNILDLDYTLIAGEEEKILIIYKMKQDVSEGEFNLKINSVYGVGVKSEETVMFSGVPIESSITTVLTEKTCLGRSNLEFSPNPVDEGLNVMVKISNLSGCDNKTAKLRTNPCTFAFGDLESCILKDGECSLNLKLENKRYYVCIDKNNDGDMTDFGENKFEDLVVLVPEPEIEEEEEEIETNISEGEEITPGTTGGVIVDLKNELLNSSGLLVLLEITLLLILFVLIVISFRLKGTKKE
tara:strand:+ start:577 stop:1962 length:1386 start_codon:yes stop_codon:yes gene_type:complete